MLFSSSRPTRTSVLSAALLLLLLASLGIPDARLEARVEPLSFDVSRFGMVKHTIPSLPTKTGSAGDRNDLSRDIVRLRGKLYPAQLLHLFDREFSAEQLLKITRLQGPWESDRLLASVGLSATLRQAVCGTGEGAGRRLVEIAETKSPAEQEMLRRIWPELHGELQNEVVRSTRQALVASCAIQFLYE